MKRTGFSKKSKNPISKLRSKADKCYQTSRDRITPCEVCGNPSQVYHHFVPKSVSNRLRYDMSNAIPLCNGCHMRHHQANDPRIHGTVILKRGEDWHKNILRTGREIIKVNQGFYKEAIERLCDESGDN